MAKDGYKNEVKMQGSYKGKVRGIPRGMGDNTQAPSPKESPVGHTLCGPNNGARGGK